MPSHEPPRIGLFCLEFRYMGGRERDCLAIGRGLLDAGAEVVLVTADPPAGADPRFAVSRLDLKAYSIHGRFSEAARQLAGLRARGGIDAMLGFEKMPGLDFYYGADTYQEPPWAIAKLLPRYRTLARLRRLALAGTNPPYCFFLTEHQARDHQRGYGLRGDRLEILPPVIHGDRVAAAAAHGPTARRASLRRELRIAEDTVVALSVATASRTKGVDLAISAAAEVPGLHLVIVGPRRPAPLIKLADRAGIAGRVTVRGYAEDIMGHLAMADVLLHPARTENTGTVIVEALLAGRPVIVTANCGYACLVSESGAGIRVPANPPVDEIVGALTRLMEPDGRRAMTGRARETGDRLGRDADLWRRQVVERVLDYAHARRTGRARARPAS